MRSILHELREVRSDLAALARRQEAVEDKLATLASAIEHRQSRQNGTPPTPSSQGAAAVVAQGQQQTGDGGGSRASSSRTWEEFALAFNRAIATLHPSSSSPRCWSPSHSGCLAKTFTVTADALHQTCQPFTPVSPTSPSSSSSSPFSCVSLPSPPLPPSVSPQALDSHRPRVLSVLPQTQLAGCFDRPWVMEGMAVVQSGKEASPRHEFPTPDLIQYFNDKRPVVVGSNEPFRKLVGYSHVRI